jgi:hypothetical protein
MLPAASSLKESTYQYMILKKLYFALTTTMTVSFTWQHPSKRSNKVLGVLCIVLFVHQTLLYLLQNPTSKIPLGWHLQPYQVVKDANNNTADLQLDKINLRRPQRILELPFEEQKGSWIGNQWVPPDGWRQLLAEHMRNFYKGQSVLWIGDLLARRTAMTMYGILQDAGNSSDGNVPIVAVDANSVINVNKKRVWDPCRKWIGSPHQPRWCQTMPGGIGDYAYLMKTHIWELGDFIADELAGNSNVTENIDTIIVAMGNWDASPGQRKVQQTIILAQRKDAIDLLGKLQSKRKTVIFRTSGFTSTGGAFTEFYYEVNNIVVDQIDSISTRLQQENRTVSNLTCINWTEVIELKE